MPVLRQSSSDFTAFVKAAAAYTPSGSSAKAGPGPVAIGARVKASQMGALASPTTAAVVINGVTPTLKSTTNTVSPFSPSQIVGCQLWLDATDVSKLTFSSGTSNVTIWGDKAAASNATANTPIAYAANGLGTGYPGLTFTNSQLLLGNTSITGTGLAVFSVFNMNSTSTGTARIIALAATGADDYNNAGYLFVGRKGAANIGPNRNGVWPADNVSYNTTTMNTSYFDGTNAYTATNGGTSVSNASSGSFAISTYAVGYNTNPADVNSAFYGYIGEVLVYNSGLTALQRQKIEGYLAWKWGLQSSLPAGHPYKSSAPSA